jgi:multidrug resistance protein, MATE family
MNDNLQNINTKGYPKEKLTKNAKKKIINVLDIRTAAESNSDDSDENITKENIFSHIIVSIFSSCFSLLCIFLIETANLIFMGKTANSNLNVDSVGLGNIYLNFIGVLLGFGILGGLDTMGSYCFGLHQFERLGIYTIRTRIILATTFLTITLPLAYFSNNIFSFISISPVLAGKTSQYILYMLPTVFLTFNFNLNLRYLQVMQKYLAPSIITLAALFIHIKFCYIFIFFYEMDINGVCLASFLTMLFSFIISSIYIIYKNPYPQSLILIPPLITYDKEELVDYFKLCIFSGIQHYGDYVGYEIVCLMCSYLQDSSMAATLIVLNYLNVIGYIYVGFSFPLAHMVGLFLGKKEFNLYHYCLKLYFWINIVTATILSFTTFYFSEQISYFYTNNEISASKATLIFKIWTIGVFCDVFNIMYQAILRGAGKQKVTSIWNITMSIFWMAPVSYILCFYFSYDVFGIWIGCTSYVVILTFVNFGYFILLDEKKASKILEQKVEKEENSMNRDIVYSKLGECEYDEELYI